VADTKKMRSIEERKAAMLAELAELEGKQLEKYRKELAVKVERAKKVDETIAKYTSEATKLDERIAELNDLIDELESDDDETVAEVPQFAGNDADEAPVLEYSNA
jgi:predicted RNase H-like nuclease (RuvC/YqgF family)